MWDANDNTDQEPEMIDIPFVCSVEKKEIDKMITQVVNLVNTYGPEIKVFFNKLVDLSVDMNARAFDGYIKAGFTREEALALVISSNNQIKQGFQNMKGFSGMK